MQALMIFVPFLLGCFLASGILLYTQYDCYWVNGGFHTEPIQYWTGFDSGYEIGFEEALEAVGHAVEEDLMLIVNEGISPVQATLKILENFKNDDIVFKDLQN